MSGIGLKSAAELSSGSISLNFVSLNVDDRFCNCPKSFACKPFYRGVRVMDSSIFLSFPWDLSDSEPFERAEQDIFIRSAWLIGLKLRCSSDMPLRLSDRNEESLSSLNFAFLCTTEASRLKRDFVVPVCAALILCLFELSCGLCASSMVGIFLALRVFDRLDIIDFVVLYLLRGSAAESSLSLFGLSFFLVMKKPFFMLNLRPDLPVELGVLLSTWLFGLSSSSSPSSLLVWRAIDFT